jgi:hypothetical protein
MTRTLHLLKRFALRKALVISLCASLVVPMAPRRAQAQGLTEYALILALIAIIAIAADELPPQTQQPAGVLIDELHTAIESASAAQGQGSVTGQISALNKAIGIETALEGTSSQCTDCSLFDSTLQEIIDASTAIRAKLIPAGK